MRKQGPSGSCEQAALRVQLCPSAYSATSGAGKEGGQRTDCRGQQSAWSEEAGCCSDSDISACSEFRTERCLFYAAQRGDPDPTSTEREGGELTDFLEEGALPHFEEALRLKSKSSISCANSADPWDAGVGSHSCGRIFLTHKDRTRSPLQPDYLPQPEPPGEPPFQDKEKLTGENIPGRRQQRPRMSWENKQIKQLNQNKRSLLL